MFRKLITKLIAPIIASETAELAADRTKLAMDVVRLQERLTSAEQGLLQAEDNYADLDIEETINEALRNHQREQHEDTSWLDEEVQRIGAEQGWLIEDDIDEDELIGKGAAMALEVFGLLADPDNDDDERFGPALSAALAIGEALIAHGYLPKLVRPTQKGV